MGDGYRDKANRVQGIGGIPGKALALSIIGGAVYGVIKLVDLVTDSTPRSRQPGPRPFMLRP